MISFEHIDMNDPSFDPNALHTEELDMGNGSYETVTMPMHSWYTLDYIKRHHRKNLYLTYDEARADMEPGMTFQDALIAFLKGYLYGLQESWQQEDAKASAAL
jgi:hypothetical protein